MSEITQAEFEQIRITAQRKVAGPWTWVGACDRWVRLGGGGELVANIHKEVVLPQPPDNAILAAYVGKLRASWASNRQRHYAQAWADLNLIAQGYSLVDPITFTRADQLGPCDFAEPRPPLSKVTSKL